MGRRIAAALLAVLALGLMLPTGSTVPLSAKENGKTKRIALTFDDGPSAGYTAEILDILREYNVKATFFVIGKNVEAHPDLLRRTVSEGHEIGNHGYAHPHPDQLSVAQNQEDIQKAETILEQLIGEKPVLYAPPYGECGENCLTAAEQCGYTTILWTADTIDWEEPAPSHDVLVARVTGEKLQKGAILLMHPKPHTAEALEDIILTIGEKGYTCVKVSEVL